VTIRRRAVIALLVAFPVGWMYIDIGWPLVVSLLDYTRTGRDRGIGCFGSGLSDIVEQYNGCDSYGGYHFGFAIVELLFGTALAVVIVYGLARFVTAPLREVTRSIEQLGPTNLGLRLRRTGPAGDETRRLADTIDGMLDRVSEGYEAQRRFAANASHELRTPLATQRALIEISLASALTAEQLDLLSRQLLATNERNEKLVDGTDAVETLRPSAKERELELTVETSPSTVLGEAPLLERLVTNLVQNAIKYNHPGGSVAVDVAPGGRLTVVNTGPEVPPEAVGGLFEPFRRLSGERLDHGGGVGLGLTIARSIVAAHDGVIEARANPGGGLVVEVTLPPSR
jgi:signal transduction histidine kinase